MSDSPSERQFSKENQVKIWESISQILDASSSEEGVDLLYWAIKHGPFCIDVEEAAASLLIIIEETKYVGVRDLAIERLQSMNLPQDQKNQYIQELNQILQNRAQHETHMFIKILTESDLEEDKALDFLKRGLKGVLLDSNRNPKEIAQNLVSIVKKTRHALVKIEAIKALEALKLPQVENEEYIAQVREILSFGQAEKRIQFMADRIIELADEGMALYELSMLWLEGSRLHAQNLEAVLRLIKETSTHHSVKDLAAKSLQSISSDSEIIDLSHSDRENYRDDLVGPPILSPSNTLN